MNDVTPFSYRPAHHNADGTFRNPPGSPLRVPRTPAMWRFFWSMARHRFDPKNVPHGHRLDEAESLPILRRAQQAGEDGVTWVGHAAFLIRLGGLTILTDPYLTKVAGPAGLGPKRFVSCAFAIRNLPPLDVILLSHNHYDHLDEQAILQIPNKDRITVIVPLRLGDFFRQRGYTKVVELDWYQYIHLGTEQEKGGVRFTALPVVHWSRRFGQDFNTTLWAGFALEARGRHMFFSGDTGYGDVFKQIGAHHGPFDDALIGIGAYAPRRMMEASHASPEEAVQIGLDIGARNLIAMHWGTVLLSLEPPFEPPHRFLKAGIAAGYSEEQLWIMKIGETRALSPRPQTWPENA